MIRRWKIILKKLHLSSTMKFVVFIVALAMQCVSAKSHNGYGYFDEKFSVLEWIAYLKRLSLIVLMLCSVVLYYVPKSRLYARKACCALIDLVANGLKFALTATETEYEKIKANEQDENNEPRIQELYRNVCEENIRNNGQKHITKIDIGDNNYKSVSKCEKRKSYTKHNVEEKHERYSRHNHRHHRNTTFKNILSESATTSDSLKRIIDKNYEEKNVITLHDTFPKTKIMTHNMSDNNSVRINDSTDVQEEKSIRNHEDYAAENSEIKSFSSQKRDPENTVPQIINKSNIEYKSMCKDNNYQDCNYNNSYLSMTKEKHDKVTDGCQHQSKKNCVTTIINGQIADSRYEGVCTKRELRDRSQRENHRFLHDTNSIIQDGYENPPIITNRVKPVLLRVLNWFFGGCPEASRRHREQIDEVGKEEIFKSTNTWLL